MALNREGGIKMNRIIVVGANHAGTAAIKTILSQEQDAQVTVFDKNSNISFLGCGMALWIGQQINSGDGLFYASAKELEDLGATVYMETEVQSINFEEKSIVATSKNGQVTSHQYDKIILATGSVPIVPNVPGSDLKNVQFVKLYQNAVEVIEKLQDDDLKNIVVVGAGYIGVELAEAFARLKKNVTIVDLADKCLANYYDDEFCQIMSNNLQDNGVKLALGERLLELKGDKKVSQVVTDKGVHEADMVILCIGFKPNTPFEDSKLERFVNGAYVVNKKQQTSIPDVYAIGDCATVYDNSSDDTSYIALATNAVRSGIVAAHNVTSTPLESIGVQGANGISIFDLKMVSCGMTYNKATRLGIEALVTDYEDHQMPEFMESNNPMVKLRIVYDKNTRIVLGAQMASEYDMSMGIHMFSLAIQEKVTIDRLKLLDIFFLPHFNKPYNYITMAALSAK